MEIHDAYPCAVFTVKKSEVNFKDKAIVYVLHLYGNILHKFFHSRNLRGSDFGDNFQLLFRLAGHDSGSNGGRNAL